MGEPIKEGDLVQVIRPTPCCGSTIGLGVVYTALAVGNVEQQCDCCGEILHTGLVVAFFSKHPERGTLMHGHMIERLKRIPPLSELEGEKQEALVPVCSS